MKIKSIEIKAIGGIGDIKIQFDDRMNFICGPNGIGKTTVLECIAHSFSSSGTNILKRNVLFERGSVSANIEINGDNQNTNLSINDFSPDKQSRINGLHQHSNKLLSLKVNRTFVYQPLTAVGKDVDKLDHVIYEEAKSGVNINEVKNWFVNRFLYSAHPGSLSSEQIHNLELAKSCFSILNPDFSFSKVLATSNEIMVNSPNGEIYYEYLSSGFKSSLSIIFGIIKDIELRFKEPAIKADEFDGIILIDELELHLHPEWQSKIAGILLNVFPNIQFITSTHSPHILQNALPKQIIALASERGNVYRRELNDSKYGFQGWTVEEILIDVMGMSDTKTDIFKQYLADFEMAINNENYGLALVAYKELDALIHPSNSLRKILKLDLECIKKAVND